MLRTARRRRQYTPGCSGPRVSDVMRDRLRGREARTGVPHRGIGGRGRIGPS
jgi:hypothetical protein